MSKKTKTTQPTQAPAATELQPAPAPQAPVQEQPTPTTALTPEQVTANLAAPERAPKYAPRATFNLSQPLTRVAPNPKRGASATRYAHYAVGRTLAECKALGLTTADFAWDLAHGYIALGDLPKPPTATTQPAPAATA